MKLAVLVLLLLGAFLGNGTLSPSPTVRCCGDGAESACCCKDSAAPSCCSTDEAAPRIVLVPTCSCGGHERGTAGHRLSISFLPPPPAPSELVEPGRLGGGSAIPAPRSRTTSPETPPPRS